MLLTQCYFFPGKTHIKDYLPNVYCHTQHIERAVANTMFASQMAIGYQNRHGFIISIANSRKRLGKRVTKGDFEAMYDPDDLSDEEEDF